MHSPRWVFARIPESIGAVRPVVSVAAAALSFGAADTLGGSGFLAVYLVGLAVGSTPSRYRRQLAAFHEGVAFVAQVGLFVLLGLLVFPHDLPHVALPGIALALALMFVARPAAVWASTLVVELHATANACCSAGRGCAARPRSWSRRSCSRPTSRTRRRSSTSCSSSSLVSALVQGTTLELVARALGLDPARAGRHASAPPRRVRSRQLDLVEFDGRRRTTPSTARPCASSDSRATRSSPSSSATATRSRRAAARVVAGRRPALRPRSRSAAAPDLEDVFDRWRR